MTLICGIDEAGRGPCIGPLILAGVLIDEKDLPKLEYYGIKDSKLLTHKKRIIISKEIKKIAKKIEVLIIQPKEIDSALNSQSLNLNRLEAIKSAMIINLLKPDKVILDCPSVNIRKYADYLRLYLKNKNTEIIAEHKADVKYPICSAASIIAKCVREEEVKKIEKIVGESIGTGYPSNEVCQKFLKENWYKYSDIFRKSWVTWKDHKIAKAQKKLSDF